MSVDFTEKAKRYQAIDEIIASGRKLKWNQIISELSEVYNIKTSRTSFFRDIEELEKNTVLQSIPILNLQATFIQIQNIVFHVFTQMKMQLKPQNLSKR